ncbi:hypothetical protein CSUI_011311 [Cystoisospora suis]|uniref:SAYSvFN domain-containing protein n=1 Tax=Cystoisospora suis TaxID=483139 RepID=A0A2C6JT36_9APIC|nr:hypothetical protein CSUI_011311 [Cystoisospora suis]
MDNGDEDGFRLGDVFSKEQLTALCTRRNILRIVAAILLVLAVRRFGALAGTLVGFGLILWNLRYDETGGSISAYSVFNRGARHLLGDLRPGDIDRQLRNDPRQGEDTLEQDIIPFEAGGPPGVHRSRDANKKCSCGSGKKTKKCCARQADAE